jgi:hypothetical protein
MRLRKDASRILYLSAIFLVIAMAVVPLKEIAAWMGWL